MAGARCLACEIRSQSLPHYIGNRDEPLAVCSKCSCLICGHHGHRDRRRNKFFCILCDPNRLKWSAARLAPTSGYTYSVKATVQQVEVDDELYSTANFDSLEDFENRRPGYGEAFFEAIRGRRIRNVQSPDRTTDVGPEWRDAFDPQSLPPDSQELLAAAARIISEYEIRDEFLDQSLRVLRYVEWG